MSKSIERVPTLKRTEQVSHETDSSISYVETLKRRSEVIEQAVIDLYRSLEIPAAQEISSIRRDYQLKKNFSPELLTSLLDSPSFIDKDEIFDQFIESLAENGVLDDTTQIDVFYKFFSQRIFKDDMTIQLINKQIARAIQRRTFPQNPLLLAIY